MSPPARRRLMKGFVALLALATLGAVNGPVLSSAAKHAFHERRINSQGYKERAGHWSVLPLPKGHRVNAIHAAVLRTGKVLIIAGSGNDKRRFRAGNFRSLLWDPATDRTKVIHTPHDLFCGGHAFLPDGRLLVAGGTRRYEVLKKDVKRAAGVMAVKNESPTGGSFRLAKGTRFASPAGTLYRSTEAATVKPAETAADGGVAAGTTEVWVEAVRPGRGSVADRPGQYELRGVPLERRRKAYGLADSLDLKKQEYWGDNKSYLFDPASESYERVSNLTLARWYPTLVGLSDGRVLGVSGLDQFGRMIQGHNEIYDPATKRWAAHPELARTLPTYPSLFLMPSGKLFYSGSNAGYGSDQVGRRPGIWNLEDNSFQQVPGLRDPTQTETSGSVLLPPAQDQRYMVAGGGGVGDSTRSTARTDIADLTKDPPRFEPGPDLAEPTRYPNLVITPDDKVAITGGSSGYRGAGQSDHLLCHLYDPRTGSLERMADPTVGRNYHSEALLLPDGRIVTLGGDPLYRDADDRLPGTFEQRIEIYSPPYLYRGERPELTGGPEILQRGTSATFSVDDSTGIRTARLIRPSAVTHVTDPEQRSVALDVSRYLGAVKLGIPKSVGLLPAGWYMLFVTNRDGVPSKARWVRVA